MLSFAHIYTHFLFHLHTFDILVCIWHFHTHFDTLIQTRIHPCTHIFEWWVPAVWGDQTMMICCKERIALLCDSRGKALMLRATCIMKCALLQWLRGRRLWRSGEQGARHAVSPPAVFLTCHTLCLHHRARAAWCKGTPNQRWSVRGRPVHFSCVFQWMWEEILMGKTDVRSTAHGYP